MEGRIQKLIAQGEGLHLDFKHQVSDSFKIAKSIVSFANKLGGTLLIGVSDSGKVVGIDNEEEIYMLDLAATNYVKPKLALTYVKHKSSKSNIVLECKVPKGEDSPYLAKDIDGKWTAYVRYEDECKKLSPVSFIMLQNNTLTLEESVFSQNEQKVIDLFNKDCKTFPKNQLIKRSGIGYNEGLKTLANLLRCNVIEELYESNHWVYKLV